MYTVFEKTSLCIELSHQLVITLKCIRISPQNRHIKIWLKIRLFNVLFWFYSTPNINWNRFLFSARWLRVVGTLLSFSLSLTLIFDSKKPLLLFFFFFCIISLQIRKHTPQSRPSIVPFVVDETSFLRPTVCTLVCIMNRR